MDLAICQFIDDFSLIIKQCCCIVWSVEKIQKVQIPKLQRKKNDRIMLLEKCEVCDSWNQNLSKSKKLADY